MSGDFLFEAYYSIEGVLLVPFLSIGLTLFLLGFYVLLFGLTVYFLCTRPAIINPKLHLVWTSIIFTLSISAALIKLALTVKESVLGFSAAVSQDLEPLWYLVAHSIPHEVLGAISDVSYIFSNCLADAILLYRFFILWGSRWCLCIIPSFALVAANAIGMASTLMYHIITITKSSERLWDMGNNLRDLHYFMNAANSLVLTLLIAGRIWWLSRDSRMLLGREARQKYNSVIAVIVESGFMYSASLIIHASVEQSLSTIGFPIDLFSLISLMVGIAPTLIILRTSLGLSDSAVPNTQISTLRFGDPPQNSNVERPEVHTVDLQPEQGPTNESGDIEAQKREAPSEMFKVLDTGN